MTDTPTGEPKPLILRKPLGWWLWCVAGVVLGAILIRALGPEAIIAALMGRSIANDMEAV